MNESQSIKLIAQKLRESKKIVVLTGAGASAESNVPTFRGQDGWWKNHSPEELATPQAFRKDPRLVWEWYGYRQQLVKKCQPNPTHYVLAQMESLFPHFTLITQNVDGLHRRAGSKNILELHGNLFKARCSVEEEPVMDFELKEGWDLPCCCQCGSLLRPHIVWFGESLDPHIIQSAFHHAIESDLFLSVGTSGMVQPAASLPLYASSGGAWVAEINLESTPLSSRADISIMGKSGEILSRIWKELEIKDNEKP